MILTGRILDLTGQRFGKLVAKYPIMGRADKKRLWHCMCDCGATEDLPTFYLTNKKRTRCKNIMCKLSMSVGDTFGSLTITHLERDPKKRQWIATSRCSCGETKVCPTRYLYRGSVTDCGCKKPPPTPRLTAIDACINSRMSSYKANANSKGREFSLDREAFAEMIFGACYYCGNLPSAVYEHYGTEIKWTGIDRLVNSEGYNNQNCVSCCDGCNYLKCGRDVEDFVSKITDIAIHIGIVKGLKV